MLTINHINNIVGRQVKNEKLQFYLDTD